MHQPVFEEQLSSRLVRQLDLALREIATCTSYSLSASMMKAYAERVWLMNDEITEKLI